MTSNNREAPRATLVPRLHPRGRLFRSVRVGAVVDGFSRKVLAIAVAPTEPSALFAVRLLRRAIREFGPPTWGTPLLSPPKRLGFMATHTLSRPTEVRVSFAGSLARQLPWTDEASLERIGRQPSDTRRPTPLLDLGI